MPILTDVLSKERIGIFIIKLYEWQEGYSLEFPNLIKILPDSVKVNYVYKGLMYRGVKITKDTIPLSPLTSWSKKLDVALEFAKTFTHYLEIVRGNTNTENLYNVVFEKEGIGFDLSMLMLEFEFWLKANQEYFERNFRKSIYEIINTFKYEEYEVLSELNKNDLNIIIYERCKN